MALSTKRASTHALVILCEYATANGFEIFDMPPFDPVNPVHVKGSWHYDRDGRYGQAVDINWPGGGRMEHAMLTRLIPVAQSLGLAVIFNTIGHFTHMHVDVGSRANIGRGWFTPAWGSTKPALVQAATHTPHKNRDNLYGPASDRRVDAVRRASRMHGTRFPYGTRFAQECVGVTPDGVWGAESKAAHDATVKALQIIWGLTPDGVWGRKTEAASLAFQKTYGRGL